MSNGAGTTTALAAPTRQVELPPPTEDENGNQHVYVTPGTIHLVDPDPPGPAKTILWTNNTGAPATIYLVTVKDLLLPLNKEDLSQPQPIAAGGQFAVGVVDVAKLPKKDLRDYRVHCDRINGDAEGDSSPHVGCP